MILKNWVTIDENFMALVGSPPAPSVWAKSTSSAEPAILNSRTTRNARLLYLIVPFWYASAAYQASLVEPWFVFWRDVVEPKYPW